jgi:hypothetical protein
MKEFDDLISVWKEQKENSLSVEQVLLNINTQRNKMAFKLFLAVLAMFASVIVMIAVWIFIDIKSIYTHIGLSMLVSLVFIYSILMIRNLRSLKTTDKLLSPKQHIAQLKKIQQEQNIMNTYYLKIYFVILTVGLLLYYQEILAPASMLFKVITYVVTISWLLFAQFYIGRRNIAKNNAKMQAMLNELEKIENQL